MKSVLHFNIRDLLVMSGINIYILIILNIMVLFWVLIVLIFSPIQLFPNPLRSNHFGHADYYFVFPKNPG